MPIVISPNKLYAKDPNGDGYLPANTVSYETTEEQCARIEDFGDDEVARIQSKADEVTAQLANAAEVENMFAGAFNTTTNYITGQYVIQTVTSGSSSVNKLFRFIADHAAGAWTGTDAIEVAICNDVSELKSALSEETQNIWKYGDVNNVTGYVAVIRSDDDNYIPAGTYTLSAEIERTASGNCRMFFYKDAYASGDLLANPYLASGARNATTFTLDYDAHIVIVASGPSTTSTETASWKNIQLELGTTATPYIKPLTAIDFVARGNIQKQSDLIGEYDDMYIGTPDIGWSATGDGYYVSETGSTGSNNAYHYSDLIPVNTGYYCFRWKMGSTAIGGNFRIHGYDSNGDWVKQLCALSNGLDQANEFAYFYVDNTVLNVRISIKKAVECTIDQITGDHFGSPIEWKEKGISYTDGSVTTASNRIHTKHPINPEYSIKCDAGYQVGVYVFDPNLSFVGTWNGAETVTGSVVWYESVNIQDVLNVVGTQRLIFLSMRKSDDGAISLSDSSKTKYVYASSSSASKEINILMIGNSFTQDENAYLPALLKEALPDLHFRIGILYKGSSTLEIHADYMENDTAYESYDEYLWNASSWTIQTNKKPSDVITKFDWDIITFTTANASWMDINNDIIPYLGKLIDGYSAMVNKNVKFALFLSHIYADGYSPVTTTSADFYNTYVPGLVTVYNTMPIFDLIQTGTAVENARTTTLKQYGSGTYKDMTADGRHLQEGICCLVPAYLMLMKVADLVGENKVGDFGSKIRPNDAFVSAQNIPGKHPVSGETQGVTDANCLLAAKCAMMAYKHPYEITNCSGFNPST